MENVFPPFRVDIGGTFMPSEVLREARAQYRNEQIGLPALQVVEDAEVYNLVERLKQGGMKVVTDGGFRERDFVSDWEGYHRAVLEGFAFLTGVIGGDVLAKQHLSSPAEVVTQILSANGGELADDEKMEAMCDDIVGRFKVLLDELYSSGCRYVQFDGLHTTASDMLVSLNNRVLAVRPVDMYVAFHDSTEMLIRLHGANAYFLNYDSGRCDRSRLLWFIREKKAVFGFVLSHHPVEDELDELQDKIEEVLNYIPLERFTLCLPDTRTLLHPSDTDERKQWNTLQLGMQMAKRLQG